jgi:hypothetical protein
MTPGLLIIHQLHHQTIICDFHKAIKSLDKIFHLMKKQTHA